MKVLTRDHAIVLRRIPLGETSWIVSLLGAANGRVRLVARGVRAPRSRLGGSLEVGNELDVVFDLRPGRDLGHLREASLCKSHLGGRLDLAAIGAGFGILEILERAIPEGGGESGLVEDVRGALAALGEGKGRPHALIILYAFERRLLDRLGVGPEWEVCAGCAKPVTRGGWLDIRGGTLHCRTCVRTAPGRSLVGAETLEFLRALGSQPWDRVASVIPDARMRRSVGLLLHRLLGMHLERYRLPAALRLIQKVDSLTPLASPIVESSATDCGPAPVM